MGLFVVKNSATSSVLPFFVRAGVYQRSGYSRGLEPRNANLTERSVVYGGSQEQQAAY